MHCQIDPIATLSCPPTDTDGEIVAWDERIKQFVAVKSDVVRNAPRTFSFWHPDRRQTKREQES